VPLNGLTNEKNASLAKIEERSQLTPVAIGILGVTEKVLAPALNPGVLYAVAYRKEGVPKDLEEALKVGVKEVQAAQKRKDRGEKEEQPESGDKKPKGSDWHPVLTKYGLTEKDLVNGAPKFIRVNGYELPTDASLFVFVDTNGKDPGKIVTHIATTTGLATGSQAASELVFDGRKGKDGERAHVGLKGCLPLQIGQKRMVSFTIDFTLDCPPPSDAAPWRMPGK
jgi:hypothetical protein